MNNSAAARPGPAHVQHSEVFKYLRADSRGLSSAEAASRLARHGPNRITPPPPPAAWKRFVRQFHNVLIYVLLGAAIVTAALQHWVDTSVILGVVLINAVIGFIQEGKAERALDAIRRLLSPEAMVLRDDVRQHVPAADLVPGDIVLLAAGDKVPADLRLFRVRDLRIDESMLTGESVPVDKDTEPVAEKAAIGDRSCMAYSGTLVTYGIGRGIVVATGDGTEIGRISGMLREVEQLDTPLIRQMARFGRWLSAAILAVAVATVVFGVLVRGYTATEMFLAAVALAVAAIPEGLPPIMTIILAIGVQRMALRNAIIRRLPAVETLGAVTVICSDKTGTLTRNEMMVQSVLTRDNRFEVTGRGYVPHGDLRREGDSISPAGNPVLHELAQAGLLCNDAVLSEVHGDWHLHGDPTEGALVTLGLKVGHDHAQLKEAMPRQDVIPFEAAHSFMATLHHDRQGHAYAYVKGAPERVLAMCTEQRRHGEDQPLDRSFWEREMRAMAARGERLLAVAFRALPDTHKKLRHEDIRDGLTLLGVVGIVDPPREEAIRAIKACHAAGIAVKMITGDHALTAAAIGREMNIGDGEDVVSGSELDQLSESELEDVAATHDVFARTSPEHKLRLVRAMQAQGAVVAMTGDGVNDAPALKRADVGVAMGRKGTEAAKEAAAMVLSDDNFASIASAVEEGRTVYDNLKKAIIFILPTSGGEALALLAAIVLGTELPITPAQILWVNMITAVTLSIALAFEPPEPAVMSRPPRDPNEPLLSAMLTWRVVFVSLVLLAGTLGLFLVYRSQGLPVDHARTVAVNTLVMFEIFYLFNSRYVTEPVLNARGLLGNRWALVAIAVLVVFQLAFTYLPAAQFLFRTRALALEDWMLIVAVGSSVLWLVEAEKAWLRRKRE